MWIKRSSGMVILSSLLPIPDSMVLHGSQGSPSSERTPRWNRPFPPSSFIRVLTTETSLSLSLVVSLFALFCVFVPPLQGLLNSEVMIQFKGALDNAGACCIPITRPRRLVVGQRLKAQQPGSDEQGNAKNQGQGTAKGV